jgi:hypothetical protein
MPLPGRFGSIFFGLAGFVAAGAGTETEAAADFLSVAHAQAEPQVLAVLPSWLPLDFGGSAGAAPGASQDVSRSIGATIPIVPFQGIGWG